MSRIAAAIIAYNSEAKLKDLLESIKDQVDYMVVGVDSKTTDATEEVAKSFGAITYPFDLNDDFAAARNLSFSKVPDDTEWIIWLDTDDTLKCDVPLHQIADEQPPDIGMVWFQYVYHRDEYGNVTTLFDRERLIRRAGKPLWQGALHETCALQDNRFRQAREERVWVEQPNRSEEGKGERNFRILNKMVENPSDHRAVLYLAHQYFASTEWLNACLQYEKFVGLSSPGDVLEEKWQAVIYLTKARRSLGDIDGSLRSANQALLMCPAYSDAYFELAHSYAVKNDWNRAIHWHEEGLQRKRPDRVLIQNPLDYTFNPFVVAHHAYFNAGDIEKALATVSQALELRPKDQNLVNDKIKYLWFLERKDAVESTVRTVNFLLESNEPLKAQVILQNLPCGVDTAPPLQESWAKVNARLAHLKDEVEYENFYFMEEDTRDVEEMLTKGGLIAFPRVDWTIERLKAMGAKKVLEVGLGDGIPAILYAKAGFQVVGIDVDPRRVQKANKVGMNLGLIPSSYKEEHRATTPDFNAESRIQFHYGSAEHVPQKVKDLGPFDAVIAEELLEHVVDPVKVLDELSPLGKHVILTTPDGASNYQYFQNKINPDSNHSGHVRALSQQEVENLILRRGRLVESHILGTDYLVGAEYAPGEHIVDRPPVAIYCGAGLEPWNPDQINDKGLGGSETAVVKLAEQLVAQGLRVMVYGPSEGAWNGVFYRHFSKFIPGNPVLAFISWRNPGIFDQPIHAQLKYLWAHDTDFGPNLTEERAAKVNGVMALSEWHVRHLEEMYPFIAGKCFVIGNGIDPARFEGTEERVPHRFAYASSPDRGLEKALQLWPKIREALPDAELRIYYGWENFVRMGQPQAFQRAIMELADQPGVIWVGRVGQQRLAKELMQSSVLFYPSHPFNETFCIAALEAQAAGCVPVTRDNGALPETNSRGILVPNDASDERWVKAAVLGTKVNDKRRAFLRDWALTQTWALVAQRFLAKMREQAKSMEVVESAAD